MQLRLASRSVALGVVLVAAAGCSEVDRTRWAARFGSADAQYELGERFASGEGVEQDLDEALVWLEQAAENGSAPAQMRLVALYDGRGDAARAERWLRTAAEGGDLSAQTALADRLLAAGGDPSEARQWIEKAAEAGDPRAQLALARQLAAQGGKDAEIVALVTRAAEQGDPDAAWELARLGEAGAVAMSAETVLRWVRAAADAGQPAAQHALGERYVTGKGVEADLAEARRWYERSAQQGHAAAQEALGLMYHTGKGVGVSPSEAEKWYLLAAEQNRPSAQNQLGVMYAQNLIPDEDTAEQIAFFTTGGGQHVSNVAEQLERVAHAGRANNDRKAVDWYRRAAAQEFPPALRNLAKMIDEGRGGAERDPAEALRLYTRAAELGDPEALGELALRYSTGNGVPVDPNTSFRLLVQAAEAGHGPSQVALGLIYADGRGVPADAAQAAAWFRRAVASGEERAEVALASLLAMGNGVERDDETALGLFERAAERGDATAMYSLGVFHEEGRAGLAKNDRRAVQWWTRAAEKGHHLAQAKLGVAMVQGAGTRRNPVEGYAWLLASGVPETKAWTDALEKELPAALVAKGRKLAGERRALREAADRGGASSTAEPAEASADTAPPPAPKG